MRGSRSSTSRGRQVRKLECSMVELGTHPRSRVQLDQERIGVHYTGMSIV
jgi:hypothetical protein